MVKIPLEFFLVIAFKMIIPAVILLLLLFLVRSYLIRKSTAPSRFIKKPRTVVTTTITLCVLWFLLSSIFGWYHSKTSVSKMIDLFQKCATLNVKDFICTTEIDVEKDLIIDDSKVIQEITDVFSRLDYDREPDYGCSLATRDFLTISIIKKQTKLGHITVIGSNYIVIDRGLIACRYLSSDKDLLNTLRSILYPAGSNESSQ